MESEEVMVKGDVTVAFDERAVTMTTLLMSAGIEAFGDDAPLDSDVGDAATGNGTDFVVGPTE